MKKIIFRSPVDFYHGGKLYRFVRGKENEVPDAIALNSFIKSMAISIVDVAESKDSEKTKPVRRRKVTTNADSRV